MTERAAPVDVLTEIEIDRPRAEVSEFAATPDNAPHWYANIESVEWKTEPPVSSGTRVAFLARFLGRRLAYTYDVKTLLPGELLVMATSEGPFPMETTHIWTDTPGGGTRMSLRNRGRPSGFGRISAPIMAAAIRRANRKDLARLKQIVESRPA